MKYVGMMVSLTFFSIMVAAQETILVETKIFEAAKGVEVTKDAVEGADFFANKKIEVMSAPKLVVESGKSANISVIGTDAKTGIPEGQILEICPTLKGDTIYVVTHAETQKVEKAAAVNTPFEFSGTCANGGTLLLTTKNEKTGRTECVYLKVTRMK